MTMRNKEWQGGRLFWFLQWTLWKKSGTKEVRKELSPGISLKVLQHLVTEWSSREQSPIQYFCLVIPFQWLLQAQLEGCSHGPPTTRMFLFHANHSQVIVTIQPGGCILDGVCPKFLCKCTDHKVSEHWTFREAKSFAIHRPLEGISRSCWYKSSGFFTTTLMLAMWL